MLRIVFMGSPEFAVPCLEKLHNSKHEIIAVVSNPDKRRGRGNQTSPTPVKAKAVELGLKTIDAEDVKSEEFAKQLEALKPDLLVVVAFRILPGKVLEIPAKGSINLHASLLPKYRGAAPIHWAVMNGETETGCTVFFLNDQVDTGNIISRVKTEIGANETTGDIYSRLMILGSELLLDAVDQINSGNVATEKQNDSEATPAPKLFTEDAKIDFHLSAKHVHNKIRGLNPFPVAWCTYSNEKMNIYSSLVSDFSGLKPGELKFTDQKLYAGCSDSAVELLELQLPGKKRMSGIDFANGYDLLQLNQN
jgi:methionyl-tRNA formyltransferase